MVSEVAQNVYRAQGQEPGSQPAAEAIVDAAIIHDLLNPLTSIRGNLDLLNDTLHSAGIPNATRRIRAGLDSSDDLCEMLENLRYLMAEEPRPAIAGEDVDIKRLIEGIYRQTRDWPTGAAPEVRVPQAELSRLRGEEDLIRRVLNVLVRAAVRIGTRAMVEAGPSADGQSIEFHMSHRGRCLPEEVANRLFEPQFARIQLKHGLKIDRARGLWFARAATEAHGGELQYEPQADGGVFLLRLPSR